MKVFLLNMTGAKRMSIYPKTLFVKMAAVCFSFVTTACFALQECRTDTIKASAASERYEVLAGGSVVDAQTGLQWLRCVEGLNGESCEQGEPVMLNWAEALLHVNKVNVAAVEGQSDWRLPNVRELNSLVELQCANPSINAAIFPATPAVHTWTSSPYHFYTHYSWFVDFSSGAVTYDERIQGKALRLVRNAN